MSKGGARARSGPAPDPNALRRERDGDQWRELPAEGRQGETPEWPLSKPVVAETRLWDQLWSMPQAVVWEEQRQELQVALYCRRFVEASDRRSATSLSTLVKQLAEDLGLSLSGMARNQWRIGSGPAESRPAVRRSSSKAKLKVVAGGG